MTEWTTVAGESAQKIILDNIGDEFVGNFVEIEHVISDDGETDFEQAVFRNNGTGTIPPGLYAIGGYKVIQAMRKVKPGTLTRLRYVKDLDTSGGKLNPMKDVTVETANSPK